MTLSRRQSIRRTILQHSIWLSLLFHLLFMMSFVVVWHIQPIVPYEPKPAMYIPSYAVNLPQPEPMQPQQQQVPQQEQVKPVTKPVLPLKPQTDKSIIPTEKPVIPAKPSTTKSTAQPAAKAPTKTSRYKAIDIPKAKEDEAPVHLIGEKKTDDPLVKLLGAAISQRLQYPRIAVDFHLTGTSYIGFTLHPNGEVTGARIVHSSGTDILDNAALNGIRAVSPLGGANQYVPKERYLVVGIIFR